MSEVEEVPFDVNEEIQVDDLEGVKQAITPPSQGVLVEIRKASVQPSNDKALKSLKLELEILEGIPVNDPVTGETQIKFKGKKLFPGFMDMCIWADPEKKNSQWYLDRQHLLGFKSFCKALEIDLKSVKVNDEFCQNLIGRRFILDIVHQKETIKNDEGKRVETGELQERLTNFKKAE